MTTDPSIEEIQAEIERTRNDLADTVDELTSRLDVKTRAKERVQEVGSRASARVHDLRDRATDDEGRPTPTTLGAGGAAVAVLVVVTTLLIWRRHR
jgi:Protein of unknown function (DUF3618)